MKVLYIYRHPSMGYSIGKVFRPIEQEMGKYVEINSIYMLVSGYMPIDLWKNIYYVRKILRQEKYDIVHITGTEHYLIPFLRKHKLVVTVHDLGFYTNQKSSLRSVWKYLLWIKTLKFVDKITFISEKSYLEAKKLVNFRQERCIIIHNPIGADFEYTAKQINKHNPTILQVGTKPNKNLNNTIVALRDFKCHLRIVGKLDKYQKALLQIYHTDYSNVSDITDEEIKLEYAQCDIVNFPSFYEGFGMPVIEGQAIGRVVVTSNLSPMKDLAGQGAVLVNPADVDSIRHGYQVAMANADTYVDEGLKNVRRYNIDTIVEEYFNLYKELCLCE